jgi:hypothetical protein
MDKDEGRTRILDDLEEEETYKEVERLRAFDDFAVIDPSLTEENEEIMVFPALGRGGSLKMRYALEEVAVAVAVAMVARRREMLKFMVMMVIMLIITRRLLNYELTFVAPQRLLFFILARDGVRSACVGGGADSYLGRKRYS